MLPWFTQTGSAARTTDFGDWVDHTLDHYVSGFQNTQKYQDYPGIRTLLFGSNKKTTPGGKTWKSFLRLRPKNSVRWVGYFDVGGLVSDNYGTVLETMARHFEQHLTWDTKLLKHNSGEEQLVNTMRVDADAAMEGIWNDVEERLFSAGPSETALDGIRGLEYWGRPLGSGVVDQVGGFNGQTIVFSDGTTSTVIAVATDGSNGNDASLAANANLRNWVATHTGDMDNTTVEIVARAKNRTNFKTIPDLAGESQGGIKSLVMSQDFCEKYARLNQGAPDDWNGDAAGKSADVTANRLAGFKLNQSPVLDTKSTMDIYGLNSSSIYGFVMGGEWMTPTAARQRDGSPSVWYKHITGSCGIHCENPRTGIFRIHAPR